MAVTDLTTLLSKFLVALYADLVTFGTEPTSGLKRVSAGDIAIQVLGVSRFEATSIASQVKAPDGGAYFQVTNGIVAINSGALSLQNAGSGPAVLMTALPTVTSAGTSPSITANGTVTCRINVGTGGTATTIVLAMPTATTGWNASAENITGTAANRADSRMVMQSSTTTSLTLQYQTVSTGAAKAFTASDIVSVIAFAY